MEITRQHPVSRWDGVTVEMYKERILLYSTRRVERTDAMRSSLVGWTILPDDYELLHRTLAPAIMSWLSTTDMMSSPGAVSDLGRLIRASNDPYVYDTHMVCLIHLCRVYGVSAAASALSSGSGGRMLKSALKQAMFDSVHSGRKDWYIDMPTQYDE